MDVSSSSDEENLNVESSDDLDSEVSFTGYGNEPEYTEQGISKLSGLSNEIYSGSEDEEEDNSRLENLHWCTCQKCFILPSIYECKCCREPEALLNDKLNGISCVTLNEDFKILCLNKTVLDTAFVQHRRYLKNFKKIEKITGLLYVCFLLLDS